MNRISLIGLKPFVFRNSEFFDSEIWNTNFFLEKGKSYLIQSASGKGKSSLCSFIYGSRNDYDGQLLFDNEDIKYLKGNDWDEIRRKHIGMLFQDFMLFPELTALENVLLKNNLTGYKTHEQILDCFERLGIADKMNSLCSQMSIGQMQRTAFIRALCQPYDFIMLDEPVSNIDKKNAKIMVQILLEENKRRNAGIIVTSVGADLPLKYDIIINL